MKTKAEYTKRSRALLQRQSEIVNALTNGANLTTPEAWNDLHDAERQIVNDIRALDSQYAQRNWTASDWNSYKLVAANVD